MYYKDYLTKSKFNKLSNSIQENSYSCKKCGRKEIIRFNEEYRICSWCGNKIYKNERDYFKNEMKKLLNY